jgi:hypothetical protein
MGIGGQVLTVILIGHASKVRENTKVSLVQGATSRIICAVCTIIHHSGLIVRAPRLAVSKKIADFWIRKPTITFLLISTMVLSIITFINVIQSLRRITVNGIGAANAISARKAILITTSYILRAELPDVISTYCNWVSFLWWSRSRSRSGRHVCVSTKILSRTRRSSRTTLRLRGTLPRNNRITFSKIIHTIIFFQTSRLVRFTPKQIACRIGGSRTVTV